VVPASDGRCTRARPASHVWTVSVDVRRRTRRNAYTIRGAAPGLNHRTSCRGSRGSASLLPSPKLIVKPRGLFAETLSIPTAQRLQSKLVQLTVILDSNAAPSRFLALLANRSTSKTLWQRVVVWRNILEVAEIDQSGTSNVKIRP
jgi:hypothetical protein